MVVILQARGLASWPVSVHLCYISGGQEEYDIPLLKWWTGLTLQTQSSSLISSGDVGSLTHKRRLRSKPRVTVLQTLIWAHMLGGDADWWGWRREGCPCCFHESFLVEWIMKEWKLMLRYQTRFTVSMQLHRKAVKIHKATGSFCPS